MCKTYCVGLPQVLDHAVHPVIDFVQGHGTPPKHLELYLRHAFDQLTPTKTLKKLWGGVVAHVILVLAPVPIGLGLGFGTALGLGLSLWGLDFELGTRA